MGVGSKRVQAEYTKLVGSLGTEFSVLMDVPLSEIEAVAGERVAEGVGRVRSNNIAIEPGYDGQYGKVAVWPDESVRQTAMNLGI